MESLGRTDKQLVRAMLAAVAERPTDLATARCLADQLDKAVALARINGPRREFWQTKAGQLRARCEALMERPLLVAERVERSAS